MPSLAGSMHSISQTSSISAVAVGSYLGRYSVDRFRSESGEWSVVKGPLRIVSLSFPSSLSTRNMQMSKLPTSRTKTISADGVLVLGVCKCEGVC